MTRKTAIQAFFAIITARAVASDSQSLRGMAVTYPKEMAYLFTHNSITIKIDGRTATFTAKELADALGAK